MPDILEKLGLSRQGRKRANCVKQAHALPVLLYHRFHPAGANSPWTITMPAFERQLEWLTAKGYRFVRLQAVIDALRHDGPGIAPPAVSLTVDDDDVSVYTLLYPVVCRLGIPMTLFVYPSTISRSADVLSWSQLAEMVMSGFVDVQYHSLSHPDFAHGREPSAAEFHAHAESKLSRWRRRMEQDLAVRIEMLSWPYGVHDRDLVPLAECPNFPSGFPTTADASAGQHLYAVPRICIFDSDRGAKFETRASKTGTATTEPVESGGV